ncbi:RagB/SusD family nutrient uptake outer membrane protein, partial [Pseudomonas donghuensis]|nr:RagB/SusD family nutrient uptake outer membrane protein [Pseudomonas donghuensis]
QRARKLIDSANPNARYNPVKSADFKDISYAPYDITREAILKEKRIEMAGECDRWFEVCRLGQAYERQLFLSRNLPTEASGKIR